MTKVAPVSCVVYSRSGVNVPWDSKMESSSGIFLSVFLFSYLVGAAVTLAVRHWTVAGKTKTRVGETVFCSLELYAPPTFSNIAGNIGYMENEANLNAERTHFAVERETSGYRIWECSWLRGAGKGVPLRQETSRQSSTRTREVGWLSMEMDWASEEARWWGMATQKEWTGGKGGLA